MDSCNIQLKVWLSLQRTTNGWRQSDADNALMFFSLGDAWDTFWECSAYGTAVPIVLKSCGDGSVRITSLICNSTLRWIQAAFLPLEVTQDYTLWSNHVSLGSNSIASFAVAYKCSEEQKNSCKPAAIASIVFIISLA